MIASLLVSAARNRAIRTKPFQINRAAQLWTKSLKHPIFNNRNIPFLMFQKNFSSWAKILLAWDYDDTFTAKGVSNVLNAKDLRGWQKGNRNSPNFADHKTIYSVRNQFFMCHLLRDMIANDSVEQAVTSFSDHHRFIRDSISDTAEAENISGLDEILIKKITCHHPFYQNNKGEYLDNPEDVIELLKECTSASQVLELIAQEPETEEEQNKYRLKELGKIVHLYASYLHMQEKGHQLREIVLIDDLAEQGPNTRQFWSKVMPAGIPFTFIHAPQDSGDEYIRQVRKAIEKNPAGCLADETASTQAVGCDIQFSERKVSTLRACSTFPPSRKGLNSNDDLVQNTPEQADNLPTRKIA